MKSVFLFASLVSAAALAQSAAYSPTIYTAGVTKGTVFPSLTTNCAKETDVLFPNFIDGIPYDTTIGNTPVIGKIGGILTGCNKNEIKFDGNFTDITFLSNAKMSEVCKGTIKIAESTATGTMKVEWKVKEAYRDSKCSSIGKTFSLTLKASTVADLKFPYLTSVEYNMVETYINTHHLVSETSFALDPSRYDQLPQIQIGTGTSLRSTHCDRGGADWPEAGVCYIVLPGGRTLGYLQSVAQPKAKGWADLKRSRFSIVQD